MKLSNLNGNFFKYFSLFLENAKTFFVYLHRTDKMRLFNLKIFFDMVKVYDLENSKIAEFENAVVIDEFVNDEIKKTKEKLNNLLNEVENTKNELSGLIEQERKKIGQERQIAIFSNIVNKYKQNV